MSTLDGPWLPHNGPSLSSLKMAEEVAKVVRISAERILELSRAEVLPHFRIDGGEPLFSVPILKAYVRRHLTVECEGEPLPVDLRPVVLTPVTHAVPIALLMVQDRLRECPAIDVPPCVYFLISGETILYVGQSCNLPARLVQHSQIGRQVGTRPVSAGAGIGAVANRGAVDPSPQTLMESKPALEKSVAVNCSLMEEHPT